jgi:hypothetical protein
VKVSQIFRDSSIKCPRECVALLRRYVGRVKELVNSMVELDRSPHYSFYGESGHSRFITLDTATFMGLLCRRPFCEKMKGSGGGSGSGSMGRSSSGSGGGSVGRAGGGSHGGSGSGVSSGPCIWYLAGALGAKKPDGSGYSCLSNCGGSRHPPLKEVRVADVLRFIDGAPVYRRIRALLRPLVDAQKWRFSR